MHRTSLTSRSRVGTVAVLMAVLGLAAGILSGCGPAGAGDGPEGAETAGADVVGEEPSGSLTIYAAASLTASFDALVTAFEQRYPSVEVQPVVYDGSSTLATQIVEGAPADVFASANERTMQQVVDAGLSGAAELFATNTLVIAVPAGNPAGIETLADLSMATAPSRTVVLCAPEVPCGAASETLLTAQGVTVTPASLEQSVTAVLTKVETGEADAGLVYATDAHTTDAVTAIVPEGADTVINRYPITVLDGSAHPEAARAFAEFVRSAQGQQILAGFGFGAP